MDDQNHRPGAGQEPAAVAFSVILPTHDRPRLLKRAIASVLAQTWQDFELLVVDDASNPPTRPVVEGFADERLRYLRNDTNLGAAASRNRALRRARGHYIAFLDDDDELLPGFLEAHHELYREAPLEVGFAWCAAATIDPEPDGSVTVTESLWRPRVGSREQAYLLFLGHRQLGISGGVTVRRSCFDEVGLFDEALRRAEDTDLLPRLARRFDFRVIERPLIRVHHHAEGRLSEIGPETAAAYEHLLEKNQAVLASHPRLWRSLHYKTGWLHYHSGDRRRGRRFMLLALKPNPLHPKPLGALVLLELLGSFGPRLHHRLSRSKQRLRRVLGDRWPFHRKPSR